MIAPPRSPSHHELEALIKEARARQLRRRLVGAAGVAIAAGLALSIHAVLSGGSASAITPAQAASAGAPFCRSAQLSGAAFFEGATQTMVGGVTILNTSGAACALPTQRPAAKISWRGRQLSTDETAFAAPSIFQPVGILAPGEKATVLWQWFSCNERGRQAAVRPTFLLRFAQGLSVTARSADVTPASCGGLSGSPRLAVSPALIER